MIRRRSNHRQIKRKKKNFMMNDNLAIKRNKKKFTQMENNQTKKKKKKLIHNKHTINNRTFVS